MPQRNSNFRKGDIAESLGTVLLQGIALVAPVPRSEDVGLDVVATLLRKSDRYNLVAENSFYVQLKSCSERKLEFSGKRLEWIMELELPFFIGSVDIARSQIELFACHELKKAILQGFPLRKVVLNLDPINSDFHLNNNPETSHIEIGPSVMQWSVEEMSSPDFVERSYNILKPHISIGKQNIDHSKVQRYQILTWNTNEVPIDCGNMTTSYDSNLKSSMNRAMPYVAFLATKFDGLGDEKTVNHLLDVADSMYKLGASKDGFIEKLREDMRLGNNRPRPYPSANILISPPISKDSNKSD